MPDASPTSFTARFVDRLLRWRIPLFAAALILLAGSIWIARGLQFDQNIEALYADSDPNLQKFLESKSLFGGDEFLIVAWPERDLFEDETTLAPAAAERIRTFSEQLSAVDGVNPASTQDLSHTLSLKGRNPDEPGPLDKLPGFLANLIRPAVTRQVLQLVTGALVNEARDVTAVVLRLSPEADPDKRARTFREVRALADAHDPPAFVVGEPVHIHDMFRYVQEDGTKLFNYSFIVLSVVLLILFRSLRWIVLTGLIVALSIKLTEAILVLTHVKLSMVSAILNSLVTIIGVATVTHLAVQFRNRRSHLEREPALRETLVELIPPIFWTCTTTAAGFLALLSSQITPIRSFGLMMSLASMLVFVSTVMVLPAGVLLFGRYRADPQAAPAERQLLSLLDRASLFVGRHPWGVSVSTVAVVALAGLGFTRLQVQTDFSKNFRSDSPLVRSLGFVERELGGAGTLEVNFSVGAELSDEDVERIAELSERLAALADAAGRPLLTQVNSIDQGLRLAPKILLKRNNSEVTPRAQLDWLGTFQPEFEPTLYNAASGRLRIFMRAREQQSADRKNQIIDEVEAVSRESFPDAKVSGIFVLLTFLIDSLLADQLTSFSLAAAGIFVLMIVAFRNPLFAAIGLVPNLFPIVLVIGGMGWTGTPINIATAMITCVSMGLTVDSSIHYLSAFRRELRDGHSLEQALQHTHRDVGRALVFANLALVAGFSVLTISQFIPLAYFGLLVSVAMIGGLFGNLILLPILLRLLHRLRPLAA